VISVGKITGRKIHAIHLYNAGLPASTPAGQEPYALLRGRRVRRRHVVRGTRALPDDRSPLGEPEAFFNGALVHLRCAGDELQLRRVAAAARKPLVQLLSSKHELTLDAEGDRHSDSTVAAATGG
jgi:hypothetical protein